MADSQNKVAIVTGSATGVGAAAAIMLAEKGINVVINYTRSKDDAEATAAECRAKGAEAISIQADVSEDDQCRAMAQAAITGSRVSCGIAAWPPTPLIWMRNSSVAAISAPGVVRVISSTRRPPRIAARQASTTCTSTDQT